MRDRTPTSVARPGRSAAVSLDIVLCTPHGRQLAVLLAQAPAGDRERWTLPWTPWRGIASDNGVDETAERFAAAALGVRPAWIAQFAAFGDAKRHPGQAALSVGYVGVTPARERDLTNRAEWFPVSALPVVTPRHRAVIDAAVAALRDRMDAAPVAFRLLPATFTLTDLQEVYELLLGRRVHKASFRRSLQGAYLVEPTDEWRSEGRGRPAQLFRYAPRKRRGGRRGVRFELLGG
jgi:8-oxo-dGTP diphosphatase